MSMDERTSAGEYLEYFSPTSMKAVPRKNAGIPGEIVLHVSPSACSRRFAIGAFRQQIQDRWARLYISEEDIVTGCYEELIPDAVEQLLRRKHPTPRAIVIALTCIDDLLGTDHEALLRELRARYPDTRFSVRHIDPIGIDRRYAPRVNIQLSHYDLLTPSEEKDDYVNLVGSMDTITHNSEIFSVLSEMGIGVRQIDDCETFDDFLDMSKSRLNIGVVPTGYTPCQRMEKTLGIPYIYMPKSSSIKNISEGYKKSPTFLEKPCRIYRIMSKARGRI